MTIGASFKPKQNLEITNGLKIPIFENGIFTQKLMFFYCHHQIDHPTENQSKIEMWSIGVFPSELPGFFQKLLLSSKKSRFSHIKWTYCRLDSFSESLF